MCATAGRLSPAASSQNTKRMDDVLGSLRFQCIMHRATMCALSGSHPLSIFQLACDATHLAGGGASVDATVSAYAYAACECV